MNNCHFENIIVPSCTGEDGCQYRQDNLMGDCRFVIPLKSDWIGARPRCGSELAITARFRELERQMLKSLREVTS
jgi:hypothetical protein